MNGNPQSSFKSYIAIYVTNCSKTWH